jgi:hypothetical protein
MNSYKDLQNFIEYIDVNISLPQYRKKIAGGAGKDTEPYNTFARLSEKMFSYFKFIYDNREQNKDKYHSSIDDLDKPCDCEKYKCNNSTNSEEYDNENDESIEKPIILPSTEEPIFQEEKKTTLLLKDLNLE